MATNSSASVFYLAIDTCDLRNACTQAIQNPGRTMPLEKLTSLIKDGRVHLLVHQIVREEWRSNKRDLAQRQSASFRGKVKNARDLATYLAPESGRALNALIDAFDDHKIEEIIRTSTAAVDAILDHPSTVLVEVTDQAKQRAADHALFRKAPFHIPDPNNTADALILFSTLDHVSVEALEHVYFISADESAFGSGEHNQAHPDLLPLLNAAGVRYFSNIGTAINQIEDDAISEEVVDSIDVQIVINQAVGELYRNYQETLADIVSDYMHTIAMPASTMAAIHFADSIEDPDLFREVSEYLAQRLNVADIIMQTNYFQELGRELTPQIDSSAVLDLISSLDRIRAPYAEAPEEEE